MFGQNIFCRMPPPMIYIPQNGNDFPGQPSDSAGGTFKRFLLNEARAGNSKILVKFVGFCIEMILARGMNSAKELVKFCREQLMFRQCKQSKYLTATTTRRSYYHLTGEEVDRLAPKELLNARAVKQLEGGFS